MQDRQIEVPMPDGYVELTPAVSVYYESLRAYVARSDVLNAELVVQAVARNTIPAPR